MSIIIERFNKIKSNISDIDKTKSIKIVAVSKTFSLDHIMPLIKYGHNHFGENKVQEADAKWSQIKRNRDDLLALIDLGHDVGLHFDTSLYQDDAEMLENAVEVECQSLENLLQRRVSVISFHRPAKSLLGKRGSIAGRIQTYQPEFFEEIDDQDHIDTSVMHMPKL